MSITNVDGYIAGAKQVITYAKLTTRVTVAAINWSLFDIAGYPGAGTLAGSSTTNGVVPTDATAGYPLINSFGGNKGYLSRVDYANSVASRLYIYDRLFLAGAYNFNANVTLASQPSYSSRIPGGTDYTGLEIWLEAVTTFTGNLSVAVTYTNEAGVTGRSTGTVSPAVILTPGRLLPLPLQAGDLGVQKIESVVGTVASAGTFNILVLRPLWMGRVATANDGYTDDIFRTGMPEIYDTSALYFTVSADSTSSGIPYLHAEIVSG